MPRYYFDTFGQDGTFRDDDGMECATKSEMQQRAVGALLDMARDISPENPNHDCRVEVRSGQDRLVFRSAFSLRTEWLDD